MFCSQTTQSKQEMAAHPEYGDNVASKANIPYRRIVLGHHGTFEKMY
jgi:hypothetical protein